MATENANTIFHKEFEYLRCKETVTYIYMSSQYMPCVWRRFVGTRENYKNCHNLDGGKHFPTILSSIFQNLHAKFNIQVLGHMLNSAPL